MSSELLDQLEADGFRLSLRGAELIVVPASRLTDDLRAKIKAGRAELVEVL